MEKIILICTRWGHALLLFVLLSGCDKKKEEEPAPLDDVSGAPLVRLQCGAFRTFTQQQWDQPADDQPGPGTYLARHFGAVFLNGRVNGLVIGIVAQPQQYLRFTSAAAVQDFLPQTTLPEPLALSAENPPAGRTFSALAGEVAALKLNLYYDDFEWSRRRNPVGMELRHLAVASGPFQGLDVGRLLAIAELVLGGDPARSATVTLYTGPTQTYTFTVEQLHHALEQINGNFAGGAGDNGYLTCW